MLKHLKSGMSRLGIQVNLGRRPAAAPREQVFRLNPPGGSPQGRVLLSYVLDPFLRGAHEPISNAHTHHWESWQIAQCFLERGFAVDVVSYLNRTFQPSGEYRFFVSARTNFERLAAGLPRGCVKVAHLDTAHWLYNNQAAYQRLLQLQQRRGVTLDNAKTVEPNWAIEHADLGTVLGNDFTIGTYRYAGKPLHRIPISVPETFEAWAGRKDVEACRHRYLWFGSSGFVHKGLDLVLEAFAAMPDKELVVCGPFAEETRFLDAYHRELFELPNVEAIGWVDTASERFRDVAQRCIGLVYPTCSEGGGGSVLTCMHAGLIPIVSRQASVDVEEGGLILEDCSIEEIERRVRELSDLPAAELETTAEAALCTAQSRHSRPRFAEAVADFVDQELLQRSRNAASSSAV